MRALGSVEFQYGSFFHTKGDWKAASEHYRKSITYNEQVKFRHLVCWGWGGLGNVYTYLGDPETGRSYGEKGLKMQKDASIEWFMGWQHLCLGDTYLRMNDLKNARTSMEEAVRFCEKNHERQFEALAWIFLGRILGRTDTEHIDKAEECMLRGVKISDEQKAKPFYALGHLFLGELYAHSGQKEKALEHLTKAETMFQEMGMDYWLATAREISAKL